MQEVWRGDLLRTRAGEGHMQGVMTDLQHLVGSAGLHAQEQTRALLDEPRKEYKEAEEKLAEMKKLLEK